MLSSLVLLVRLLCNKLFALHLSVSIVPFTVTIGHVFSYVRLLNVSQLLYPEVGSLSSTILLGRNNKRVIFL